MTIYHAEHDVTLHLGHVFDVLPTLPAESVNCVVTSPPYYGLRDYGTATWESGSVDCDHTTRRESRVQASGLQGSKTTTGYDGVHGDTCSKCGARRVDQQIGLEASPAAYVETLRGVFAEVRRVLRPDGVLWLNLGDSYSSGHGTINEGFNERSGNASGARKQEHARPSLLSTLPPKNLLGVPWRVAFALQDDGWTLRNDVIWAKPNAMPESVTDRLSTRYEHVFLFSKSRRYWFDLDAIRETHAAKSIYQRDVAQRRPHDLGKGTPAKGARPDGLRELNDKGANPGDVWEIATSPYPAAHFATFPPELARRCITAGCPPDGTVLDPFTGSGTTLMVARRLLRNSIGIELNPAYCELIVDRIGQPIFDFGEGASA